MCIPQDPIDDESTLILEVKGLVLSIKQQATPLTVDPYSCSHMASLGHRVLRNCLEESLLWPLLQKGRLAELALRVRNGYVITST